jgi:AcrR family transcriptional regulator
LTIDDSTPRRRALRRGGLTRRQLDLLEGLQALLLAEGFRHLSLDDLATRLRCSKTTLYALAPSKEQLVVAVVNHYFKGAAERIEAQIADVADVRERIVRYLAAIGEEMQSASTDFIADVDAFDPARQIYERNTRAAAERIHGLVTEGIAAGVFHDVHAAFAAEMIGATIAAIQRGEVRGRTGLTDSQAFTQLSTFVLRALQPDAGREAATSAA